MSNQETGAFIGLGVMGYPMAGHLASNGLPMRVYNRTGAKADRWTSGCGDSKTDGPAHGDGRTVVEAEA